MITKLMTTLRAFQGSAFLGHEAGYATLPGSPAAACKRRPRRPRFSVRLTASQV